MAAGRRQMHQPSEQGDSVPAALAVAGGSKPLLPRPLISFLTRPLHCVLFSALAICVSVLLPLSPPLSGQFALTVLLLPLFAPLLVLFCFDEPLAFRSLPRPRRATRESKNNNTQKTERNTKQEKQREVPRKRAGPLPIGPISLSLSLSLSLSPRSTFRR